MILRFTIIFLLSASCFAETIHVLVALCDNVHQGIVPVPVKLGNGEDPRNNLYWGALYGIKTHFKKSKDWQLIETRKSPTNSILERCIFKHHSSQSYIVADAYRGKAIKLCTQHFFAGALGRANQTIEANNKKLGLLAAADLITYIGHNGLMDFQINVPTSTNKAIPSIVLACKSQPYFGKDLTKPLILTKGFMAPEAYTLEAILKGWFNKETKQEIHLRAAKAYHKYQKCGVRGAKNLFWYKK